MRPRRQKRSPRNKKHPPRHPTTHKTRGGDPREAEDAEKNILFVVARAKIRV
jgi:hypothetical protein